MNKNITEAEYKTLGWSEKNQYVKEWACVCNECKHKWHYLDSVEKQMNRQERDNNFMTLAFCCNPCVGTATTNANTQIAQQKAKLKSCPECGSSNVTKNAKIFKKQ